MRDSPFGPRWCHLGGRALYGEDLETAALRHLNLTLSQFGGALVQEEPYFVNQFFPDARPGMGVDPRKHAIAVCFLVEFPPGVDPETTGAEGSEFRWFALDEIPSSDQLWPGTRIMIEQPGVLYYHHDLESYSALSARCASHNELMWQSPVLAMTAMAFLLTIGLGESDSWKRALAAILASLVAIVSAQLMARHSRSQISDSDALAGVERRLRMLPINRKPPATANMRRVVPLQEWLAARRSRVWWFRALLFFAGVSLLVSVEATISWLAK